MCVLLRSSAAYVSICASSRSELCEQKPAMVTKTKKILYLVSIAKFANLSGNQVSLVLFYVDCIDVILK